MQCQQNKPGTATWNLSVIYVNSHRHLANSVAMLVRREVETLNALLRRLDKAIGKF